MNNYNPNIHHRKSIRLKGYDYSQSGLYFITICVQDRKCLFGKIVVGVHNFEPIHQYQSKMILNDAGKIANDCWLKIPKHFPNAVLHEHIVMPNHVHGIIELQRIDPVRTSHVMSVPNQIGNNVGTRHVVSLPDNSQPIPSNDKSTLKQNQFSKPIPGSVSVIIQQYKSSVKRLCNKNDFSHFLWQSRFYEHIIRDEKSYQRISEYIINNPKNWKEDDFFNA